MKKFKKLLSVMTIIAIVGSMTMVSVNAASGDLALSAESAATGFVFEEDFENIPDWANFPTLSYTPNSTSFAGLKSVAGGVAKNLGYAAGKNTEDGNGTMCAKMFTNFQLKVPEFFKDKKAGKYTIEFDYRTAPGVTAVPALQVKTEDIGAAVNKGSLVWLHQNVNVNATNNIVSEWTHKTVEFTYTGSVTAITATGVDAALYDEYALLVYFAVSTGTCDDYWIDNIKITSPGWNNVSKTTYAGSQMTINNTVYNNTAVASTGTVISGLYDSTGSLVSVSTAPFSLEATDTSKVVTTVLDVPSDVTSSYTYKSFVWKDLDDTIEPLTMVEDVFDDNLLPNGSFEILPVTEAQANYGQDGVAKGWQQWINTSYLNVYATTTAHTGAYGIYIEKDDFLVTNLGNADSGTNVMGRIFTEKGLNGVYTLSFWAMIPDSVSIVPQMYTKSGVSASGTNCFNGANCTALKETEGDWQRYEVTFDTSSLELGSIGNDTRLVLKANGGNVHVDDMHLTFTPAAN